VPWKLLSDVSQLDEILEESKSKPVGIFKHSTRCGISKMVLRGFEREYDLDDEKASIYMLDLLNYRSISNEIAAKFQVFHESPQFIVLENGQTKNHASHQSISVDQLK
jgi:bacillithiol system protein YtxJ